MLWNVLLYKDVFTKLKNENNINCLPTVSDWNVVAGLYGKLEFFFSITELFLGTAYPTANSYFNKLVKSNFR